MPHDYRILIYAVLACVIVVFVVFSFPALTPRDHINLKGITKSQFEAILSQELSFCQSQKSDINCRCFANVSGNILADKETRIPGALYADKHDLARGQAANSC